MNKPTYEEHDVTNMKREWLREKYQWQFNVDALTPEQVRDLYAQAIREQEIDLHNDNIVRPLDDWGLPMQLYAYDPNELVVEWID